VDVGCGVGSWAASFAASGIEKVIGVDGTNVDRQQLQIDPDCYVAADLTKPFSLDQRFDLAVSLEVAEHLPPQRGASFVADLVRLAPAILFSAAIPGQRGRSHLNEQWQGYWASLFADHGLVPVDVVRPKVWNDSRVEWWYAQNTFLYLTVERARDFPAPDLVSVVHPVGFDWITQERKLGTREILTGFPGAVGRSLWRRRWSARRS
jgi:SAM-dependent methyltransferase